MYSSWFSFIFRVSPIHPCDSLGVGLYVLFFSRHDNAMKTNTVTICSRLYNYQIGNGRVTIWLNSINLFIASFSIHLKQLSLNQHKWYSHFTIQHSLWQQHFWQRRHLFKTYRWIYSMLMADEKKERENVDRKVWAILNHSNRKQKVSKTWETYTWRTWMGSEATGNNARSILWNNRM